MATTKKVQLPEGFDPYDMRLKRQFSDQADKMNVIALSRKNYNLCCGAMHNGQPCKNPAGMGTPHKGYGRCKIHGGLATGPKTAEGRARQIAASTKHGLFSKVLLPEEESILESINQEEEFNALDMMIKVQTVKIVSYLQKHKDRFVKDRDLEGEEVAYRKSRVICREAWTKDSFIYRGELMAHDMEDRLEKELGYRPKLVFKIDAYAVIASGNTNYKKAFDNQVARLGMDHIAIQTQYLLKAVDAIGRFFSAEGVARMYSGGFEMQVEPVKGHKYIWACDVAGQEEETTDVEASVGIHKRDALTFIVGDLLRDGTVVPICLYQWVGKQHSKVRDMLPKIIRYWGAIGGVCDGTGIGEPLAYHLKELFDRNNDGLVEAYKFKAAGDESKSKLGYLAYDFNHNDLIKVPKAPEDPDQLELWKELRWQVEHLTREAKRQQTINFYVPVNAEPRKPGHVPHDDLVMALFLLMRAARNIDPNTGKATAFDREKSGV